MKHAALVSTLGLLVLACADGASTAIDYLDLIAEDRFQAPGDAASSSPGSLVPAESGIVGCNDASYYGVALYAGASLSTEITLGDAPSLVLGGCRTADAPNALVFQIEPQVGFSVSSPSLPGLTRRLRVTIGHEPGPFTARVDLGDLAGRTVALRLEPHFAPGMVALEDAFVEQRVPRPRAPEAPPFQALLISVDTLRADSIGALGGPWTTPNLDRLVAEGEVFTNSWATASWTKPSHGSLLTGEMPAVHAGETYTDALHPAVPTLAERLSSSDIATGAIVQDVVHLDPRFGFDRGFDSYQVTDWSFEQMTRRTVDWLGDQRDRSFFFFLHTFETHSDFRRLPYESPGAEDDTLLARFGLGAGYGCTEDESLCASERLDAIRLGTVESLPSEAGGLSYLYGESVMHMDRVLGRFFADLERLGLWDRLLIVLTSDHGEMLLEAPGETLHGVHQPGVLRVPLVVKWPAESAAARRAGSVRNEPVSGIDIMPTLLAAANVRVEDLPGADLDRRLDPNRQVVVGTDSMSLVDGTLMLIKDATGGYRLIDLAEGDVALGAALADNDRIEALRAALEGALARLGQRRARFDRDGVPTEPALTDEERDRLRAFGYTDT